jgi:hypothetical protein
MEIPSTANIVSVECVVGQPFPWFRRRLPHFCACIRTSTFSIVARGSISVVVTIVAISPPAICSFIFIAEAAAILVSIAVVKRLNGPHPRYDRLPFNCLATLRFVPHVGDEQLFAQMK